jgi:hypothetical protein
MALFMRVSGTFFLDTGSFTNAFAQVKDACTTHFTTTVYFDFLNVGAVQRENALNTHTVRNFAYGKGFCYTGIAALEYIALEELDTLLVAFLDFVVHGYAVSGFEIGKILLKVFGADGFYYRIHRCANRAANVAKADE